MPKETLPFRLYAQILIFSALVALGALILWPLQQSLYRGMLGIRDNLISRIESQIGRKIRYSSISPSLFGSFDVRNVSILDYNDHPLINISRFRIAYSLLDILRGRALAINSVLLDSPLIEYNTATDNDLLDLFRTAGTGREGSFQELVGMLPEKITIRIRNGKCHVISGNDNFEINALDFNADILAKNVVINGKWNIGVAIAKLTGEPVNFRIAMTANGLYRMDTEEGEAVIGIPYVTGDVSSIDRIAFNVLMREGAVEIRKKPDIFPFDISFEYGKNDEDIEARLSCVDFNLSQLISFSGGLKGARQLLDAVSSGTALFKRGDDGSFEYSANFTGTAPLDLSSQAASYEIDITGGEKMAQIKTIRFSMPHDDTQDALFYGDAGFTGTVAFHPFAPDGILSFGNFSISGRKSLNADIAVNTMDSRITMFSEAISLGQGELKIAANASLEPSEKGMFFSVSASRSPGTKYRNAQKEAVSVKGSFDSGSRSVNAKLRLDSFLAGDLAGLAAPFVKKAAPPEILTELFGDTSITTEITLYTDFKQVSYNAPALVFSGKSGSFSGFASINGNGSSFELLKGQIQRGEEILLLSAQADFDKKNNIGFSINAGYQSLSYLIEGTVLDGKTVNIHGPYGLAVNITASRSRVYSGILRTEGFPVPFLGKPASLSLAAKLRYNSSHVWSIDFDRLELADITSPAGIAQFRASCHADQKGINFTQLYYKDGFGPLSGSVNLLWSANFSEITGSASLLEKSENYHIDVSFQNHSLNLGFSGSSMRLGRFSEKANSLQANGEMRLLWGPSDSFNANINLSSISGKLFGRDFNVIAQAVIGGEELTVSRLVIGFDSIKGEIPQIVFNNKTGTARGIGDLKFFLDGKQTEGLLSLNANFEPVNSWLKIGDAFDSFNGKAHFENFRYGGAAGSGNGAEPQNFDVVFMRGDGGAMNGSAINGDATGDSIMVSGGPRNMFRLRADKSGNFYAGLSSPSPIRGTVIGNISGNTINASCNDLYVDIAGLFDLIPKGKEVFLTGGYVNASVDIRGSLSDPEFFGRARGTSLRFMVPSYIPMELRPIPFNVVIEGNEIRFGPVPASVGKGAGSVNGKFLIERWIPNIFSIDITIPRETPIPYSFVINGFTARGDTSGRLNISMESMTLGISGDLYVNNTVLGINSEEIARSQGQDVFYDTDIHSVVNLKISTGPVVEFVYPNSRFPILRANPDLGTKLNVTADTLTRQFSLTSDIKIRGGEIFYFERNFYIRSGLLVLKENELRFAPRLTARADVRDRNENGPVTISMIVDNAPLLDFTARFESSPPLSQVEILALMGQSITGNQINENTSTAFFNSATDIFAQFMLMQRFEKPIRNLFNLDMFSVRTQFLQNILLTEMGYARQPVDSIGKVGNYFDNTTISLGKYIGQDIFLQSVFSMRYDGNRANFGGMTFQPPDIRFELQGPVVNNKYSFRISWDFVPEHPENWWVNDNSITLTLSRSF